MSKYNVLIIESSDWDREQIRTHLRSLAKPIRALHVRDLKSPKTHVDIVILGFSDAVSLETSRVDLDRARERSPHAQLILCAPRDMPDLDNKIVQMKARAFVLKPIDEITFKTLLAETLAQIERRKQREAYARSAKKSSHINDVIGKSEAIQHVVHMLERVAESNSTSVMLLGESGVGKSLFAQTVHELSDQAQGPFIEINCATLPSQLLESELFGYEAGAFTDAHTQKIGLIELADGGTLFLDEITEVDLLTQAKLLKFLDSKRFRRLGGDAEVTVDVRVVAATNRDIKQEVKEGAFREDLFYRLNVVQIRIPPLRERTEDIKLITAFYLEDFKKKFNKMSVSLSPATTKLLYEYDWPGNVRELINVLERAVLLCPGDVIEPPHLPIQKTANGRRSLAVNNGKEDLEVNLPDEGVSLDAVERAVIAETLKRTRGNVSKAADILGVSRGALRNKLTKYRIDAHTFGRPLVTVKS